MPVPDGPQFRKAVVEEKPPRRQVRMTAADGRFPVNAESLVGKQTTTRYAYGTEDDAGAHARVESSGGEHLVEYPSPEGGHDGAWADQHTEESGQIPLFHMTQTKSAESTVQSLYSTRGARVPAMKMLGIADIDSRRNHGVGLSASDDLSRHSERIVDNLAKRGQVKKPKHIYQNDIEFLRRPEPMGFIFYHDQAQPVSEDDQRMGSARLRSALRRPKKTRSENQQMEMDI